MYKLNMEIILCMAHIELEEKIRRVLSQELIYKAGKLIDLHPDSINKVMDCKCQYKNAQKMENKNVQFSNVYSSVCASI